MTQNAAPAAPRILALDPGSVRVGVAVSDELGLYAHPRAALAGKNRAEAARQVAALVEGLDISEVIVGLPLTLSGERGAQAEAARAFAQAIRSVLSVPVREVDERLSSAQAGRLVPGDGARLARAK
nr:Holliday junction resolvase RuvX [Tepidiformaceae bacterium]